MGSERGTERTLVSVSVACGSVSDTGLQGDSDGTPEHGAPAVAQRSQRGAFSTWDRLRGQ